MKRLSTSSSVSSGNIKTRCPPNSKNIVGENPKHQTRWSRSGGVRRVSPILSELRKILPSNRQVGRENQKENMKGSATLVASLFAASTVALTSSSSAGLHDSPYFPISNQVFLFFYILFLIFVRAPVSECS